MKPVTQFTHPSSPLFGCLFAFLVFSLFYLSHSAHTHTHTHTYLDSRLAFSANDSITILSSLPLSSSLLSRGAGEGRQRKEERRKEGEEEFCDVWIGYKVSLFLPFFFLFLSHTSLLHRKDR